MGQRVGHRTRRAEDSGQQEKVGGRSRVRGTWVCEEEGMGEVMGGGRTFAEPACSAPPFQDCEVSTQTRWPRNQGCLH